MSDDDGIEQARAALVDGLVTEVRAEIAKHLATMGWQEPSIADALAKFDRQCAKARAQPATLGDVEAMVKRARTINWKAPGVS